MSYLDNLFNLKNKVVVITGATGQLGSVFSKAFASAGSYVIGLDMNVEQNTMKNIEYVELDITDKAEIKRVLSHIYEKHKVIDILFNNAGVSTFEPFEERTEKSFNWVMDVNLKGTFFCIQAYVNLFDKYKQKKGVILNTASHFGVVSPDFRNYTDCTRRNSEVYGVTKAGILQMTRYFAVHLASRNIRVNAVSPGGVFNQKSPQGDDFIKNYSFRCPMQRMANEEEMIGAALYLSSDAASYTTGQNIIVDGGITCW